MKLEIPLTFDDVTLKQLQIYGEGEGSNMQKVLGFSGMPEDEARKLPVSAIKSAAEHIDKVMLTPMQTHYPIITIGGKEYGFIPDWSKFSAGEYADLTTYLENPTDNCHKVASVLYRPITRRSGKRYDIEEYNGTAEADKMLEMSAGDFYGMLAFFLTSRSEYALTTLKFLDREIAKVTSAKRYKTSFKINGAGIIFYIRSRATMLVKWILSLGYRLRKF